MSILTNPASFSEVYLLQLFNLQNDQVESIDLSNEADGLHARIRLVRKPHHCPICDFETSTIKGYTSKKILHSLTTHAPCFIDYEARRYVCPVCKKTFYESNPFSFKNMKISALTVYNVLRDLKKVNETFSSVANRFGISDTAVAYIFDSHVHVSRKTLPSYLLIDEVYAMANQDGNYVCMLVDFISGNTVDILPTRKKLDLLSYFRNIPMEERKNVKLVSIDMWYTYKDVCKSIFPNCNIAIDRFHLFQDFNRRITNIRIRAMNANRPYHSTKKADMTVAQLEEETLKSNRYYLLKKFNWLLMKNTNDTIETEMCTGEIKKTYFLDPNIKKRFNRKLQRYTNYYDIYHMILDSDESLVKCMNIKYDFDMFFEKATKDTAPKSLDRIISNLKESGINDLIEFAKTLTNWRSEIINSFIPIEKNGTQTHIHSGIIEQRNRVIKQLKMNSNGFRNFHRFRNRALYVLNPDATYYINPVDAKI